MKKIDPCQRCTEKDQEVMVTVLQQRKLQLQDREGCFTRRGVKPQRRLPREAGESLPSDIFRACLEKALSSLL